MRNIRKRAVRGQQTRAAANIFVRRNVNQHDKPRRAFGGFCQCRVQRFEKCIGFQHRRTRRRRLCGRTFFDEALHALDGIAQKIDLGHKATQRGLGRWRNLLDRNAENGDAVVARICARGFGIVFGNLLGLLLRRKLLARALALAFKAAFDAWYRVRLVDIRHVRITQSESSLTSYAPSLCKSLLTGDNNPMATVLTYRGDSDQPHCEIALDSGERVHVRINRDGAVIEQAVPNGSLGEVLFRGTPDTIAGIYSALLDSEAIKKTAPLDMLLFLISQLPTAADVKNAFASATSAHLSQAKQ